MAKYKEYNMSDEDTVFIQRTRIDGYKIYGGKVFIDEAKAKDAAVISHVKNLITQWWYGDSNVRPVLQAEQVDEMVDFIFNRLEDFEQMYDKAYNNIKIVDEDDVDNISGLVSAGWQAMEWQGNSPVEDERGNSPKHLKFKDPEQVVIIARDFFMHRDKELNEYDSYYVSIEWSDEEDCIGKENPYMIIYEAALGSTVETKGKQALLYLEQFQRFAVEKK